LTTSFVGRSLHWFVQVDFVVWLIVSL
jgi:hypothetical protein